MIFFGLVDLQTLAGVGHLEFDEVSAQVMGHLKNHIKNPADLRGCHFMKCANSHSITLTAPSSMQI